MRTQYHPNWALLSALLALAIGLLVARAADDRWLQRTALLLIVYGIVMIWARVQRAVLLWQAHAVRAIQSWRSGCIGKKRVTQ
jgi:hypothetical protein